MGNLTMRTVLCLLFSICVAIAQTVNAPTIVETTHTSIFSQFTTTVNPTAFWVVYDTSSSSGGTCVYASGWKSQTKTGSFSTSGNGIRLSGLAPSTTYYWKVVATMGGINYCSAEQVTTTNAAPSNRFSDPPLPSTIAVTGPTYPVSYFSTYTVAADCSDLQAKVTSAAADTASGNSKIIIPHTNDCSFASPINIPANAGSGVVVITTDGVLPPIGVRVGPNWLSQLPVLRNNQYAGGITPVFLATHANTNGWIWRGIKFSEAFPTPYVKTMTGVSGTTYTVPSHGFSAGQIVQVCDSGTLIRNLLIDTVPDSNTFTGSTYFSNNQTCSGGSWAIQSPPPTIFSWVDFTAQPNSNVWCDQCYFRMDYAGAPTTGPYAGASFYGFWSNGGIVNSYFDNLVYWRPVNPVTGVPSGSQLTVLSTVLDHNPAGVFLNNYVNTPGISVIQQSANPTDTQVGNNLTIRRNLFQWDDAWRYGSSTSNGLDVGVRQALEFKQADTVLIEGNTFNNIWQSEITGALGNAIVVTPRCGTGGFNSTNGVKNLTIRYNRFNKVTGIANILGGNTANLACDTIITKKVLISHNVASYVSGRFSPTWASASPMVGQLFYFGYGFEDMRVEHNTFYTNEGAGPVFIYYVTDRGSGLLVKNNLWVMSEDADGNGHGWAFLSGGANDPSPGYTTTNALTKFQTMITAGPGVPDPASSFSSNYAIPALTSTASPSYYTDPTKLLPVSSCTGVWQTLMNCAGSTETTASQRLLIPNWTVPSQSDPFDFHLLSSSPYNSAARVTTDWRDLGADVTAVNALSGDVYDSRVLPNTITTNAATVAYTRPADTSCTVEYGTSAAWGTGSRITDAGTIDVDTVFVPVTVDLTGLTTATTYYVRILCPSQQPSLQFTTH